MYFILGWVCANQQCFVYVVAGDFLFESAVSLEVVWCYTHRWGKSSVCQKQVHGSIKYTLYTGQLPWIWSIFTEEKPKEAIKLF